MTKWTIPAAVAFAATSLAAVYPGTAASADEDRVIPADAINWSPGPASIPPGAQATVLYGETVIRLNSTGPWALRYVNPADDPRN